MTDNNLTGWDWCADHVHIAGDRVDSSVVTFEGVDWVDSNLMLCPFCGAKMSSEFTDEGLITVCTHECKGWLNERSKIKILDGLKKQIDIVKNDIKDSALKSGVKVFAKEYASHRNERDSFDEEIASLAK